VLFAGVLIVPFAIGIDTEARPVFWSAVAFLAFLQVTASLLNLMPIPGVDGGNLIAPWLPPNWQRGFAQVAPFGMLLLFALLWEPRVNRVFFDVVFFITDGLGLPSDYYATGYDLFRFWT
jgi:Zn-dependent protease